MFKNYKKILPTLIRLFYTIFKVGRITLNNVSADYIVWAPNFFSLRFFSGDDFQKIAFSYFYLKKKSKQVTVYTKKDIGRFSNKKIIYIGGDFCNIFNFNNYINSLINISENLESQNNNVFPSAHEVRFWENKGYMHEFFEKKFIRTPETKLYDIKDLNLNFNDIKFPLLLKEEHSCSARGVHKIESKEQLKSFILDEKFCLMNKKLILQRLLNMRRDLRVILVGNEIILHYWRINLSDEWKPTSTGFGSQVDFENFPENWRSWIIDSFNKLKIRTGAFDIAWENDDLRKEPYILEISPFYQPNPIPKTQYDLRNYGKWKKSTRFYNSYQLGVVNVIELIQKKFIDKFIETTK